LPLELERVLEKLDLSPNERRTYELLLRRRESNASDISKSLKVSPTNVYAIINKLVEKGLVVVSVERPARFQPVSLSQFFDQLIIRHQKEMMDQILEFKRVKESLSELEIDDTVRNKGEGEYFQIVKGINAFTGKFFSSLSNVEKELFLSLSKEYIQEFEKMNLFDEIARLHRKRKWQCRLIIDEDYRQVVGNLDPTLDVKFVDARSINHELIVMDNREVFYNLKPENKDECLVLWTNYPAFRTMAGEIFEYLWSAKTKKSKDSLSEERWVSTVKSLLEQLFTNLGLSFKRDVSLVGEANMEYHSDFILFGEGKSMIVDFFVSDGDDETSAFRLLRYFVKVFDLKATISKSVLVVHGKIRDEILDAMKERRIEAIVL